MERQECTGKERKKDLNYLHESGYLTDVRKLDNLEVGKADRDRGMDESHSSFCFFSNPTKSAAVISRIAGDDGLNIITRQSPVVYGGIPPDPFSKPESLVRIR